jgi:PAS domain S-box-containing protein
MLGRTTTARDPMSQKPILRNNRAWLARLAATATTVVGLVGLAGWALDFPLLRTFLPGAVEMKANTSVGLILCGASLLILAGRSTPNLARLAHALAVAAAALGAATLAEYIFAGDIGIDQLLFPDSGSAYVMFRGRMSPVSATALVAAGTALATLGVPNLRRLTRLAAICVIILALAPVVDHAWNGPETLTGGWLPPIALSTAAGLGCLGFGILRAAATDDSEAEPALAALAGVEIRILGGIIAAFALLLFAGGYAYRASAQYADTNRLAARSSHLRAAVADLVGSLSGADSALRDYILTADFGPRDRYLEARGAVERLRVQLPALAADSPEQQHNLALLGPMIDRKETELSRIMAAYQANGLGEAERTVAGGTTLDTTGAIGALIKQMSALEEDSVRRRDSAAAQERRTALVSLLGALALASALFIALFRGIHLEMVGRESAERALRASERYNRSIVESSPDCMALLTLEARLIEMTAQSRRLMRIDASSPLENSDWMDFWKGADLESARAAFDAARQGGPGRFQALCPTLDGTPKWWDVIVAPIPGVDGKPERLLAVSRDITEVKHTETTLLETNRFLDSLIEAIPNMIFVKDAADRRYVRVNRAGEQLLGMSRAQIIGKSDRDLFPAAQADSFMETDRAALAGGQLIDISEESLHTPGRGVRTLHTMKMPIVDENGLPRFLLGISADITERKQSEAAFRDLNAELRRKASELETSIRELESFSYSVSHDLRAPLRAIDGFALMIEEDYAERLDEEGRRFLAVIRGNSKRMGALIDDLLEFSRLGRRPVAKSAVDMDSLAREVIEDNLAQHPERAPRIEVAALPAAHADPRLLRQVWVNLVANAFKYTSKAPSPEIQITGRATEREVIYSVRDNGVGFDMEYCDKLFQVFQRLHRSDEFGGTGVGLAIVHRVVSRHGGRVWAAGKVGQGAEFSFALPKETLGG